MASPPAKRNILNDDAVVLPNEDTGSSPPFGSPLFSSPPTERAAAGDLRTGASRIQMTRSPTGPVVPALEPEGTTRADEITLPKYIKAGTSRSQRGLQGGLTTTPADSAPALSKAGASLMMNQPLQASLPAVNFSSFGGTAAARTSRSTMMASRASNSRIALGMSRSLRASKASEPTQSRLTKSSIQQEYNDWKVRKKLQSPRFGGGSSTLLYALAFFLLALVLFLSGLTLCLLNFHALILLHPRRDDILGPILMALSLLAAAIGFRFVYGAYVLSSYHRSLLRVCETHSLTHSLSLISFILSLNKYYKSLQNKFFLMLRSSKRLTDISWQFM